MTIIVTLLLIVSVVVNIISIRKCFKLLDQNDLYLQYFTDLQKGLIYVLSNMRDIDIRGAFEAEDEVGNVFKALNGLVGSLKIFILEYVEDTE